MGNCNILDAILNIANQKTNSVNNQTIQSNNRMNARGESLEEFIKDAFSDTLLETDKNKKNIGYNSVFSYLGNKNNPPDIMLKGGDAIEVKKIETKKAKLSLNSSHPKSILSASSSMITKACQECEDWDTKDLIYAVGYIPSKSLNIKSLWMYYGSIFAANEEIYTDLKENISNSISSTPGIEFATTKELGKVNNIDPLGISSLRIRGMWVIDNPINVFDYIHTTDDSNKFELVCIIPKCKLNTFENKDLKIQELNEAGVIIKDVRIKDPNNPANLINSKLLTFRI